MEARIDRINKALLEFRTVSHTAIKVKDGYEYRENQALFFSAYFSLRYNRVSSSVDRLRFYEVPYVCFRIIKDYRDYKNYMKYRGER